MAKKNDRSGKRVGNVTVNRIVGKDAFHNNLWECTCDCGRTRIISSNYLNRMEKQVIPPPCRCLSKTSYRVGMRFGRLLVIEKLPEKTSAGHPQYLCRCDCGKLTTVVSTNLRRTGHTVSCGCYKLERTREANTIHGMTSGRSCPDRRYSMWQKAKQRANEDKYYPFDLEPTDIVIPDECPLLGIPLSTKNSKMLPNSPTLDKINPELGYVKGNIWVISARANTIKSDASLEELQRLTRNLEKKIKESM